MAKQEKAASAKGGQAKADGAKEKKDKVVRIAYPGLNCGPDGKPTTKLKEWPKDFDPRAHQPLARGDFENEAPWLIARAERLERIAGKLRKEAELALQFGGDRKTRAAAKKLSSMQDKIKEMMSQLLAQGVDPQMFLQSQEGAKKDAE